jgi:transmembrane sensor
MTPDAPDSDAGGETAIRDAAARWVVRRDRQLTAAETAEFEAWLAADPRHAAAFGQSAASWRTFRELGSAVRRAPVPAPVVRPRPGRWVPVTLAAAAGLALAFFSLERGAPEPAAGAPAAGRIATEARVATRRLADGSVARLKPGAEIAEQFTAAERRVRLVRGEVFFSVRRDAARPFFVEGGGVTVRAVGTAFAVRLDAQAVDVLVTEGTVQVTPPARAAAAAAGPLVGAGHRAVIAQTPVAAAAPVAVTAVTPAQIAAALAWNEPMLELAGATLGELVRAFAERSGRRIEIADPALAAVRIGGRFPTYDAAGFVRALEEVYDVESEHRADGTILLRRAR